MAAVAIFAFTYVLISLQKIRWLNLDRPSAALLGAVLMVAAGVVRLDDAFTAINMNTLALLLGMMILVAYLKCARFFEWTADAVLRHGKTPRRLLVLLSLASAALSALFVNDTICLLFTPVVLTACLRARVNPVPFLIALVTSSNIGSAATLTGNPQNMIIGVESHLPYGKFFLAQLPVALAGLAIEIAVIRLLFAKDLPAAPFEVPAESVRVHRVVIDRAFTILALVLAGFLWPHSSLPFMALVGGTVMILFGRFKPRDAFAHVDWSLLLFFAGLFVVVRGIEPSFESVHAHVAGWLGGPPVHHTAAWSLFALAGSNVVSNVPYVLIAQHWVASPLDWYVLAMASTLAGNLTIVGSVANMIVLELSKDQAPIGFWTYLKVGLPVTLLSTAAGTAILLLESRWL